MSSPSREPVTPPSLTQGPLAAILKPALKVGAVCGGTGFIVGGAAGIIKGTTPFLFASASGLQTFALGTTFWTIRTSILQAWVPQKQTPNDLTLASGISGNITGGTVGYIVRGRSNVIPGAIMFALFGCLGQMASNRYYAREIDASPRPNFWKRMGDKSWTPMKVLTNEEYAELLREKMMKVDVEIAILDDKIAALKEEEQRQRQQELTPELSQPPQTER